MTVKTSSVSSTPASSASKVHHRRESSSLFDSNTPSTARPPSRATSVVSDSGSTRSEKVSALGKSSRINALSGTSVSATGSVVKKRVEGSMGPPPLKARSSISGTPTPVTRPASALARAGVKSPTGRGSVTAAPQRRVVSGSSDKPKPRPSVMSPTSSISEGSEKENVDNTTKTVKGRILIPST